MMHPMPLIFFDTEFTDLGVDPRLISVGFVSEDGERSFYAELTDTYQPSDCGEFARMAVLPQLEGGVVRMRLVELGEMLEAWISTFCAPVQLATDSLAWDWPWIQEIFDELGRWPSNLEKQALLLSREPAFNLAVEAVFAKPEEGSNETCLRRHHALDDAKANRLGWLAVQDSPE